MLSRVSRSLLILALPITSIAMARNPLLPVFESILTGLVETELQSTNSQQWALV